jgi:hypothetical protein
MQVQTGVSDIEAGIWTCGVRPPDPGSNVQMPREQACLRSVPLESPGDRNRNRCDREGPRGGRLGEDRDMEERTEGKADGGKSNAKSSIADSERRVQALRRPAGPQRFCTQDEYRMLLRPIGGTAGPAVGAVKGDSLCGVVDEAESLADFLCGG